MVSRAAHHMPCWHPGASPHLSGQTLGRRAPASSPIEEFWSKSRESLLGPRSGLSRTWELHPATRECCGPVAGVRVRAARPDVGAPLPCRVRELGRRSVFLRFGRRKSSVEGCAGSYINMTQSSLISEGNGMFSIMLRSCTSAILPAVLDRSVPVVWVRRHTPMRSIRWWPARVPLSTSGAVHDVEVRTLQFDLQLPTERFLQLLPEFSNHGMALFQLTRRVPDTLTLDVRSEASIYEILMQNGLHLHFYLPHVFESAQLSSPHRSVLEKALEDPEVRKLAY
jgi:hypothetical protein